MKTKPIFFLAVLLLLSLVSSAQSISISYPMDRTVFQRCEFGGSRASFYVAGQCLVANQSYTLQMKITELYANFGNTKSVYQDWTTFAFSVPYGGLFKRNIQLPGGLYNVEVRAIAGSTIVTTANIKVGVGEVFMIAGQSNAQGVTETASLNQSPYEGVVADLHTEDCSDEIPNFPSLLPLYQGYSVATQGTTNWCYTKLGNSIVDQAGVPVAFFNGARGGTAIKNWTESINGGTTYNINNSTAVICGKAGQPYRAFKNILNYYGSLFGTRGVLWHQGESDNQLSTTTSDYESKLNTLIGQARNDFGQQGLGWYVSKATYDFALKDFNGHNGDPTWPDVIRSQTAVAASNRSGPETDGIGIPRADGRVHFGGSQLADLGTAWYNSGLTNGTPICANSMPDLQVTKNGDGSYTLTGESGYSNWYWVKGDNKPVGGNIVHTGQVYSNVTDTDSYRFFAITSAGNYVVSQKVYLPLPAGSARIGAVEESAEENYGYALKISPNPVADQVSIEFTLPHEMQTQLTIVNQRGETIKVVADNHHAAGSFRYPVNVSQLPTGLYFCRLRAGDLSITRKLLKK